jgi:hypothetical protein
MGRASDETQKRTAERRAARAKAEAEAAKLPPKKGIFDLSDVTEAIAKEARDKIAKSKKDAEDAKAKKQADAAGSQEAIKILEKYLPVNLPDKSKAGYEIARSAIEKALRDPQAQKNPAAKKYLNGLSEGTLHTYNTYSDAIGKIYNGYDATRAAAAQKALNYKGEGKGPLVKPSFDYVGTLPKPKLSVGDDQAARMKPPVKGGGTGRIGGGKGGLKAPVLAPPESPTASVARVNKLGVAPPVAPVAKAEPQTPEDLSKAAPSINNIDEDRNWFDQQGFGIGDVFDLAKFGMGAYGASRPVAQDHISPQWNNYMNRMEYLSNMGLTPEERSRAAGEMDRGYAYDVGNINNFAGGNAGVALSNLGRAAGTYQNAQAGLAVQDAAMNRQNMANYGNALTQDNAMRRQLFLDKYNQQMQTKQSAALMASESLNNFINRRQYEKTYGAGSRYDQLMQAQANDLNETADLKRIGREKFPTYAAGFGANPTTGVDPMSGINQSILNPSGQ